MSGCDLECYLYQSTRHSRLTPRHYQQERRNQLHNVIPKRLKLVYSVPKESNQRVDSQPCGVDINGCVLTWRERAIYSRTPGQTSKTDERIYSRAQTHVLGATALGNDHAPYFVI